MAGDTPYLVSRLQGFGTTIFAEMSALAVAPARSTSARVSPTPTGRAEVARRGDRRHPCRGTTSTRRASASPSCVTRVAAHQRRCYGLEYDADTEVLVTAGATEAIAATLARAVRAGRRGGHVRAVLRLVRRVHRDGRRRTTGACSCRTTAADYAFDPDELAAAITPRTRLSSLNSPHNPTGKVFSRDELELVARLCVEHDLLAVTDEVYEHLVFDGEHVPLATLPGHARPHGHDLVGRQDVLVHRLEDRLGVRDARARRRGPHRQAVPHLRERRAVPARRSRSALGLPDDRVPRGSPSDLREKRDRLCGGLADAGFDVFRPRGHLLRHRRHPPARRATTGCAFCSPLPERCGVVAVPNVVFYDDVDAGRPLVRFAFCKRLDVLDEAVQRLKDLRRIARADEGRRGPARHRLGGPRGQLRASRADDRRRRRRAVRASSCSPRCSRPGSRWTPTRSPSRSTGRARGSSSSRRRRHGVWVCGSVPERARMVRRSRRTTLVLAAPDGTVHRYAQDPPVHVRAASTSATRRGDERVTVDVDGVRCSLFVCYDLRFADEFWALAAQHRLLRRGRELAGAAARALAHAAAGPGDREPGVRRRRQPGRSRRRARLRRRQRGHRPVRRGARRGGRGRDAC